MNDLVSRMHVSRMSWVTGPRVLSQSVAFHWESVRVRVSSHTPSTHCPQLWFQLDTPLVPLIIIPDQMDRPMANDQRVKLFLDIGCLFVLIVPVVSLFFAGKPYRRGFNCDDESIRYPFRESTVSTAVLVTYCLMIPALTIVLTEVVRNRSVRNGRRTHSNSRQLLWIIYNELMAFMFGFTAIIFLTNIAKYTIGRLRPHFLDVCKPDLDTLCPMDKHIYRYIEEYDCKGTDSIALKDSRLSFFSGHSSMSAYSMIFTVIYMQYKVKWQQLSLMRPLIQMSLIYLAFYTGLSRISDYKHHWSDVLVGMIIGTLAAVLSSHYVSKLFRRFPYAEVPVESYVRPPSRSDVENRPADNNSDTERPDNRNDNSVPQNRS